jgi:carbon monoxide dehydrogenase subunit G
VTSTFDLVAEDGGTLMRWRTEIRLSGLLSHVGGSGLEAVAQRQATRTLDAVERAL